MDKNSSLPSSTQGTAVAGTKHATQHVGGPSAAKRPRTATSSSSSGPADLTAVVKAKQDALREKALRSLKSGGKGTTTAAADGKTKAAAQAEAGTEGVKTGISEAAIDDFLTQQRRKKHMAVLEMMKGWDLTVTLSDDDDSPPGDAAVQALAATAPQAAAAARAKRTKRALSPAHSASASPPVRSVSPALPQAGTAGKPANTAQGQNKVKQSSQIVVKRGETAAASKGNAGGRGAAGKGKGKTAGGQEKGGAGGVGASLLASLEERGVGKALEDQISKLKQKIQAKQLRSQVVKKNAAKSSVAASPADGGRDTGDEDGGRASVSPHREDDVASQSGAWAESACSVADPEQVAVAASVVEDAGWVEQRTQAGGEEARRRGSVIEETGEELGGEGAESRGEEHGVRRDEEAARRGDDAVEESANGRQEENRPAHAANGRVEDSDGVAANGIAEEGEGVGSSRPGGRGGGVSQQVATRAAEAEAADNEVNGHIDMADEREVAVERATDVFGGLSMQQLLETRKRVEEQLGRVRAMVQRQSEEYETLQRSVALMELDLSKQRQAVTEAQAKRNASLLETALQAARDSR